MLKGSNVYIANAIGSNEFESAFLRRYVLCLLGIFLKILSITFFYLISFLLIIFIVEKIILILLLLCFSNTIFHFL